MEHDGDPTNPARFQELMLERFLTQATPTPKDDLDYLLEKIDRTRPRPVKGSVRKAMFARVG